jgi:hypothetical protein
MSDGTVPDPTIERHLSPSVGSGAAGHFDAGGNQGELAPLCPSFLSERDLAGYPIALILSVERWERESQH